MDTPNTKPAALLLMSPQCAFCPGVMEGLTRLLKTGKLAKLEMINLFEHPETARELGVRSVPWTRIGPYELEGALSYTELESWTDEASQAGGMIRYYSHLLESRQLEQVVARVRATPSTLVDLTLLLNDLETPMAVRIGVGAVLEELAGSELIAQAVPQLINMTRSDKPQIRADAAHYLSLTHDPGALDAVRQLVDDQDNEVREIALESGAILEAELQQTEQD